MLSRTATTCRAVRDVGTYWDVASGALMICGGRSSVGTP
jgi:hypothetical protein